MTTNTTIQTSGERTGKARKIAFYVFLVLFGLMHIAFGLMPYVILGWFIEEGAISHRVHLISFGWVFVLSFVALLAQLRRPETKVAQMYQVLIAIGFLAVTTIVVDRLIDAIVIAFMVLPLLLVALHPNRRALRRPSLNVSKTLAALALVAAIPLLIDTFVQFRIGLEAAQVAPQILEDVDARLSDEGLSDAELEDRFEREFTAEARRATGSAEEAEEVVHYGHWSAMGAFNLIITGLAFVAALRPPGWRLPAWSAGLSALLYGAASIANPGDASAANRYWSVFAIAWGIGFIVIAEATKRESAPREVVDPATA